MEEVVLTPLVCEKGNADKWWSRPDAPKTVRPEAEALWAYVLRSEKRVYTKAGTVLAAQLEYFPSQRLARSSDFFAFISQSKLSECIGADLCICRNGERGFASIDNALMAMQRRRDIVLGGSKARQLLR